MQQSIHKIADFFTATFSNNENHNDIFNQALPFFCFGLIAGGIISLIF